VDYTGLTQAVVASRARARRSGEHFAQHRRAAWLDHVRESKSVDEIRIMCSTDARALALLRMPSMIDSWRAKMATAGKSTIDSPS